MVIDILTDLVSWLAGWGGEGNVAAECKKIILNDKSTI